MPYPATPENKIKELIDLRDVAGWSWSKLAKHFGNKSHNATRKRYTRGKERLQKKLSTVGCN